MRNTDKTAENSQDTLGAGNIKDVAFILSGLLVVDKFDKQHKPQISEMLESCTEI